MKENIDKFRINKKEYKDKNLIKSRRKKKLKFMTPQRRRVSFYARPTRGRRRKRVSFLVSKKRRIKWW